MLPLPDSHRSLLLGLARQAVFEAVTHGRLLELPSHAGRLSEKVGVFVTLRCRGRLRGCVGQSEPVDPLAHAVAGCAFAAALKDPRFRPITPDELSSLRVEISLLSPLFPVDRQNLAALQLGVHGLQVSRDSSRGLLLPQVASELRWELPRFLAETCLKAGLDRNVWQDPRAAVHAFTVESFADAEEHSGL